MKRREFVQLLSLAPLVGVVGPREPDLTALVYDRELYERMSRPGVPFGVIVPPELEDDVAAIVNEFFQDDETSQRVLKEVG